MKSLMMKLMLIFGIMVFAVCAVFLAFSVTSSSTNLTDMAEEGLLGIRESWSIAISDVVEAEIYLLETIALRTALVNEDLTMEERLGYLLTDLEAGEEMGYLNFALAQPDGTVYVTDGTITDVSSLDYFTVPMRGENYVSDPSISQSESTFGELIRIISVPIMQNNRPVGVLILIKDGYVLSNLLTELEESIPSSGLLISRETGEFVAHLDPSRVTANTIEEAKTNSDEEGLKNIIVNMMNGETGVANYSRVGVERLALYESIAGTNWALMVYKDVDVINDRTEALTQSMIIFSIAILAIALAITYFMARNISLPIKAATEQIKYLADGDLSFENNLPRYERQKDEIGIIARSLHELKDSLANIFKDIRNGAQQVANGSKQISTTSQSVSSIASEQAASTEEISSTMEEMASNIKQNADNATKTGSISKQAVENAHKGQSAVGESLESVKKIASEISVIGSIASQTNLLALNAAIEAARAGEAGKGFAVVASEVRKLAEKSQIAATEINKLSSTTIVAAEQAHEVISTVIPGIEQTASLIEEISFASREQDTGAQQINKAIVQMDVGVQQNASSSEELASMAEELSSQAMQLIETLSFFTFAEDAGNKNKKSATKLIQGSTTTAMHKVTQQKVIPNNTSSDAGAKSYQGASSARNSDFEEF